MKRKKIIRGVVVFLVLIVGIGISLYLAPKVAVRLRCINWHEKILPGLKSDREYVFVAMGACDSVLAIDTITHEVAAAVKIAGKFPHGIAATLDRKYIYAANEQSDDLTVISVDGFRVVKTIVVDDFPTDVVPSMDGRKLFAANFKGGTVQVVDLSTQRVERTISSRRATHFGVVPNGRWIYLTNWDENMVTILNGRAEKVLKTLTMTENPNHITVSRDSKLVFVTNYSSDTLTVVDAEAGVILKTIKVGHHPMAPAITPDGRWLYVTNIDSGTVSVIDVERLKVVKEIITKGTPQHMAMDRGGRLLYVTNPEREGLQVIDTTTNAVVKDIHTGPDPQQIAPRYLSYMR
ncbi:MAG: YncE family protein [Sedimenticolaceae bacterium]